MTGSAMYELVSRCEKLNRNNLNNENNNMVIVVINLNVK